MWRTKQSSENHCLLHLQISPCKFCNIVKHLTAADDSQSIIYQTVSLKLPVPPLESTLLRYLRSVKPLLSEEEYLVTCCVVKNFSIDGGVGKKLQNLLEQKALKTENWLLDWWLKTKYLRNRTSVVVHSSPAIQLPQQSFVSVDKYLTFSSRMILGALDYKRMIDENKIPQQWMGKHPLDMSQYKKIFGTNRTPAIPEDKLTYLLHPTKHIVVAHNNEFFAVTVLDDNMKPLVETQITGQLRHILAQSCNKSKSVGVLTTENHDIWATYYDLLLKDPENKISLKTIEQSLFILCLDRPTLDSTLVPNIQTFTNQQLLHGGGSRANGCNRWYDKMIQLVVGMGGEAGMVFEHAAADAGIPANLLDHILQLIHSPSPEVSVIQNITFPIPRKLHFNLTPEIEARIDVAKTNLDTLVNDVDLYCSTFIHFGKNELKSFKVSPDSFIQIAIQLAFYRIHKIPGAQYESAAVRKFLHGRTEHIRTCSTESIEFAKKMISREASEEDKFKYLKAAINYHHKLAVEAVNGEGIDKHLLGLKMIATENRIELPRLFQDPSYTRSTHFRLATSQIPLKCDGVVSFGPVEPDGYSVCYNPHPTSINFSICSFKSDPETCAKSLSDSLYLSLQEMRDILSQGTELTSKL